MTTEQILLRHRATPFRAFVIFLADGRTMNVPNVECFSLAEDGLSFILFEPPRQIDIIDPAHIVSIRFYEIGANLR